MIKWLNKIQNSNEATKRKWVVGASAVSMVFVVLIWISYMNFLIKPVDKEAAKREENKNFFEIMKNGFAITLDSVGDGLKNVLDKIKSSRSITIEK